MLVIPIIRICVLAVLPDPPYFQVACHFEQEEAGPQGKWAVEVLIQALLLSWEPAFCFVRLESVLQQKEGKERQRERKESGGKFRK